MTPFADNVISFYSKLDPTWQLPEGITVIYPFGNSEVQSVISSFYRKFYGSGKERTFLFGINPGRFGAGVTGIPFTDPVLLENVCGIQNGFDKKNEISSIFIYDIIKAFGGPIRFYRHFYITSVCPLGFIKDKKNYNYYDNPDLADAVKPHIIKSIETQLSFGANRNVAFSIGKGQNFKYLKNLNVEFQFFDKIIALPHPRWVMQYNLKSKDQHIEFCIQELSSALELG